MSVAALVVGSTAVIQTEASSQGTMGGSAFTYTDGDAAGLECNAQVMTAREAKDYDTRGQRRMWNVFFATDPNVTEKNRLKLIRWQGVDLSAAPKFLRVLATDFEGRPNQVMCYVVICEEVTSRLES